MAKSKAVTREMLVEVINKYKEEVVERIGIKPVLLTEAFSNDMSATYTFVCGTCGEEYQVTSASSYYQVPLKMCPHCGIVPTKYFKKDDTQSDRVYIMIKEDDIVYICCVLYAMKLNEKLSVETVNWQVEAIASVNLTTKEKVKYGESAKTTRKLASMFYTWRNKVVFVNIDEDSFKEIPKGSHRRYYDEDTDEGFFRDIIYHLDSLKKETSVSAKTHAHPFELMEKAPELSLAEITPIVYEVIERDLINDTTTIKANCAKCGHEWLYEKSRTEHCFALTCPYCSAMKEFSYRAENKKVVAYISDDAEQAVIRIVSYSYENEKLHPAITSDLSGYYVVNKKGVFSESWYRPVNPIGHYMHRVGEWASVKFDAKAHAVELDDVVFDLNEDGILKYSGVKEYCESKPVHKLVYSEQSYDVRDLLMFIRQTLKFPVAEKLAKEGFAEEIIESDKKSFEKPIELDWSASTVAEAFGISKNLLKYYKKAKKHLGVDVTMQTMQSLYRADALIAGEDVYWCDKHEISLSLLQQVKKVCPDLTFSRIISYLERVRLGQMFEPRPAISEWRDYLDACKSIGMDMHDNHVLYPKALKTEHDVVMAKQKFVEDESLNEDFLKSVKEYSYLEYHRDDYFIKVPESMESMFEEGRKLKHCCGRYVDDVVEKSAFVLFMRRKDNPEEPFLSIEVSPDLTVRQVRGINDSYVSAQKDYKEINIFLSHWAKMKHLVLDIR